MGAQLDVALSFDRFPGMQRFGCVADCLAAAQPAEPVVCHRPHAAARAARFFLQRFPGKVLYAVKANPAPVVLDALYAGGIRHFDVASPAEMERLSAYPDITLHCMNPVKHPEHIRRAYRDYGVRGFALDTADELDKIVAATAGARDLALHVRVAVDTTHSLLPLDHKFGVSLAAAPPLLRRARVAARHLGVCFHVGSQAMRPESFARAIDRVNRMIRRSGVMLDSLDVGGGFPAGYPGLQPPPLAEYLDVIDAAAAASLTRPDCTLMCEPGRALVAESASLLVNVMLRKGDALHINDGAYGALFDAAHLGFRYPARAYREGAVRAVPHDHPFCLYGPTCDSIDSLPGPFLLPADTRTGDYLEIGQMGAYGDTLRTGFNGFGQRTEICLTDEPLLSSTLHPPRRASAIR